MFRLLVLIVTILVSLSVPASGMKTQLYPLSSDTLSTAASRLRAKDYESALKYAETSPASGIREFIAGIAAYRSGNWPLAAANLATASGRFELLADYALYYQALALKNQGKTEEALVPLTALLKLYADSPLQRQAMLLSADIRYDRKDFPLAAQLYQKYIEKYPAGNDAIAAQFRLALCRNATGEASVAVKLLRNLRLASPASPFAPKADEELQRMSAAGAKIDPFTPDELYRRASTLLDLKKYSQAATEFKALSRNELTAEAAARIDLKTGQALFRSRHYREAEQYFISLTRRELPQAIAAEAMYWLGRSQDKHDRHDDAIRSFLQVAERWPASDDADNALLEAALIRKSEKQWGEVKALAERILSGYPAGSLTTQVLWEAGWSCYQSGDWPAAAGYFKKLADSDTWRDRALYWLARSNKSAGDQAAADAAYARLQRDFPLSYYSIGTSHADGNEETGLPTVAADILETLPLPSNFDRIRALISFGMNDEAKKELSNLKVKNGSLAKTMGIARLYLEMDDYNGAFNLVKKENPNPNSREGKQVLALKYPLAYRDTVLKYAETGKISPQIVYAVIRSESSFSPVAVSPAGAVGLMQLMPATAGQIEGKSTVSNDRLMQPQLNISFGVRHFRDMLNQYNGDMIATIASYNAGGAAVNRWKKAFGAMPPAEFIEQIPYGETREYVKQVLTSSAVYAKLYRLPSDHGKLPLPPRP